MMGTIHPLKSAAFPPPGATVATFAVDASVNTSAKVSTTITSTTTSASAAAGAAAVANKCGAATHKTALATAATTRAHSKFLQQPQQQQQQHLRFNMPLQHAVALVLLTLSCASTAWATPVFVDNPSLAQFQSGRNIRHLPCIVRKSGRSGVCMFAIDCIKQNGTHLGTCIDRFYFGSCCQLKDEASLFAPEISDNSIDQNTISHFVHESTTLPTSTLFKLTTTANPQLSVASHISNSTNFISEAIRNVTQSYLQQSTSPSTSTSTSASTSTSTQQPSRVETTPSITTSSHKPLRPALPSRRPPSHTTHKTSQFVVRTTAKPTVAPTTIKPPRRKTTVARPILTTTEHVKVQPQPATPIEPTTQPPKFFTFQIVETTTPTPTDPSTHLDEFPTTQRPLSITTQRYRPRPSVSDLITELQLSSIITTLKPSVVPAKSTTRPKPLVTRRPTTGGSKKPTSTQTKRPTTRPTRRPVITDANETYKPSTATITTTTNTNVNASTSTTTGTTNRRPPVSHDELPNTTINGVQWPQTLRPSSTQTTAAATTAEAAAEPLLTTHAPRPRPKPTAEIVKVPKPSLGITVTTAAPAPTTTSTTQRTTTTTSTTTTEAPLKVTKKPITTHSPTKPTNLSSSSTQKVTSTSTTTPPRPRPTTSTAAPPTLTTEAPKVEAPSTLLGQQTTMKPGLITWTNVDAEPTTMNATLEEKWPAPTVFADNYNQTATTTGTTVKQNATSTAATTSTPATSTIISVSTSISEIVGNISSIMPKPERPSSTVVSGKPPKPSKPTKTTERPTTAGAPSISSSTTTSTSTTTTTTRKPTTTTTTASTTTTSTSTSSTTTTPEPTIDLESSMASSENSIEGFSTTGSGIYMTTDYNTENYNGTGTSSTTVTPVNTLEGMDYRQICGRRMFPEPRIVGGSNAAFGRWPWQISLRQWRTSTYLHKCGAALLNENWAITAAHCVENVPPSDLLLRMGEYDLAEEEEPYGYQERRVQIVASHPQFDARTFEYDLALLRFYEPVAFQPNIIPVCVPNSDIDFVGQTAFVTGWGRLYENGPLPSVLQEVAVPVINNTICESMYRAAGFIEHIPHIFICAGWKKGGYDSCEGDSGGPMVLQREDDKRFQLGGVISWGIGCAEANQPGVYTRISEFRDWINQILQF